MNPVYNAGVKFKPFNQGLKGVGGWLAFFIIGQLVLRPFMMVSGLVNPQNASVSRIAEVFPQTAVLFTIEKVLLVHLVLFGIAVGLTLWKVHTPFSVKLTKIFLIACPLVIGLDAFLFKFSDLPPALMERVFEYGLRSVTGAALWSLLWLLYFVKSERVRATYLNPSKASS